MRYIVISNYLVSQSVIQLLCQHHQHVHVGLNGTLKSRNSDGDKAATMLSQRVAVLLFLCRQYVTPHAPALPPTAASIDSLGSLRIIFFNCFPVIGKINFLFLFYNYGSFPPPAPFEQSGIMHIFTKICRVFFIRLFCIY